MVFKGITRSLDDSSYKLSLQDYAPTIGLFRYRVHHTATTTVSFGHRKPSVYVYISIWPRDIPDMSVERPKLQRPHPISPQKVAYIGFSA